MLFNLIRSTRFTETGSIQNNKVFTYTSIPVMSYLKMKLLCVYLKDTLNLLLFIYYKHN